jgi:hypothetical protein
MKPENQKILNDCRIYFNQLSQGLKVHGISFHQRKELERIIDEEFQPGYRANFECEACINEMIVLAFYYYDRYETGKH